MWIGTTLPLDLFGLSDPPKQEQNAGLARFHLGAWQAFTTANSELVYNKVLSLAASADGTLWIGQRSNFEVHGTGSGGLASYHKGAWQDFTAAESDLLGGGVSALAANADGTLWAATSQNGLSGGQGLARFREDDWQVFTMANSDLPSDNIWALAGGADGILWAGTDQGLARFHEGSWQVFTTANSDLPHDTVYELAVGADGALWAGTGQGAGPFP